MEAQLSGSNFSVRVTPFHVGATRISRWEIRLLLHHF